ncbi:uncharacterized protein MKK02DRAFT_18555 [Dioszegia hungarica]|uniref:AMP-dependent synthetase/ligase domain-containing protein n=1 Tax=Dioszegia hungarica TaxID=4972 RepID=A0AA38LTY3_9TREE|nr:uncharacterized protein MKK02DRAFT_18555 [Dioszegia hungarica]KAI9633181.1 hypothetical protein MKK02DRAFT_18555 [Dioszegia hungarica]
MPDVEIDNLTLLLLLAAVSLLLYDRFAKPAALVHPLLLGKQAEVAPVRKEGESGVYRSFATGHGAPLIVRPASGLKTVRDVIGGSKGGDGAQRVILDTPLTDTALAELTRLLPLGLSSLFPSLASSASPILVLLPPNPSTSLPLLLLSLASSPDQPLIVLPNPRVLTAALEATAHAKPGLVVVHESLADGVVEQVMEESGGCGVLVVGDTGEKYGGLASSAGSHGVVVRFWDEVWDAGEQQTADLQAPQPNDIHSFFYSSADIGAEPTITKFTHLNFTAGIAAFLSSFPADKRPSAHKNDVVASAEPLTTPVGMSIALASIWSVGAGFSLIRPDSGSWVKSNTADPLDDLRRLSAVGKTKPSVLIITKEDHLALTRALHKAYRSSSLAGWAMNAKSSDIQAGYIARKGIWDKLVWSGLRNDALDGIPGDSLRSLIVIGDTPSSSAIAWSTALLSLPTARLFSSPFSAGPVLSSHFYDIQSSSSHLISPPSAEGETSHTGAPGCNVEVVLRGGRPKEGTRDGSEVAMEGKLYARGPGLGAVLGKEGEGANEGWVQVAQRAGVRTNGTFVILSKE